ncbi:Heterokaryon incompatibility protein (HET) domain containing protein [Hyaloscypha variabilis]
MAFKHKRLEYSWQLRLVELLPRTTKNRNETIRCRILLVPGADASIIDPHYDKSHDAKRLPYIALSYCWGNPQPSHKIELDGMEYEVGSNLFEYLKQRRETSDSVMFWVDALCIDQSRDKESMAERGAQVPRMTSIYMNAHAIEIWLGPEEKGSAMAMDELNLLAKTLRDKTAKHGAKNLGDVMRNFLSLSVEVDEEAYALNEVLLGSTQDSAHAAAAMAMKPFVADAIAKLWMRPWWGRLWVVQEATVPYTKKIYRCGDRSISWLQLMLATGALRSAFTERLVPTESWTPGDELPFLPTTFLGILFRTGEDPMKFLLVHQRRVSKAEDPLSSLLPMSRSLRATDDRDRVYGLIGMATDVDLTRFAVDYSKSVEDVYREVARYLIQSSPYGHKLDILGEAHHFEPPHYKPKSSLPSWVPEWRILARSISFLKGILDTPKQQFSSNLIYGACGHDESIMSKHWSSGPLIDFQDNELQISGLKLDTISELIDLPLVEGNQKTTNEKPPIGDRKTWRRLKKVIPFHLGPIYRTQRYGIESIYDAFRRTVAADLQYHGYNAQGLRDPTRGVIMRDLAPEKAQMWIGNDYTSCLGRKLAITQGNCMGLVSKAARVGDEIFVLAGGQVLHTLRRKGERYKYLGDCYLHGFMDGESLNRLGDGSDGTVRLERVRIC